MKRIVYITLSFLLLVGTVAIGAQVNSVFGTILISGLLYLVWLLLELISSIVVKDQIEEPWDSITFMFGILTLRMNKIKYDGSDL